MLAICLQMRLMETAGDAQMLGAALNHSALNLANALGAWLGGLVIAAGLGYRAPSVVGAGLAVAGLVPLAVSAVLRRRERAAARDLPGSRRVAREQVAAGLSRAALQRRCNVARPPHARLAAPRRRRDSGRSRPVSAPHQRSRPPRRPR